MFSSVEADYRDDIDAIQNWVNEMFGAVFGQSFQEWDSLYGQLKDTDCPISTPDLERLLTVLPLDLVDASERLNGIRLTYETVKLKNKDRERDLHRHYSQSGELSAADKKDLVESSMSEYRLYAIAYGTLIARAEGKITFCKEMVMAAKKIFDSRTATESAVPIGERPAGDLPPYQIPAPSVYVK